MRNRFSRNRFPLAWLCLLPATLCLGGCLIPYRVQTTTDGGVRYEQVAVAYEFDRKQAVPASDYPKALLDGSGQQRAWTTKSLRLAYPIPEGDPESARATLLLEPMASGKYNRRLKQTELELDFPKQQLDLLIFDLAHSGFFERQKRPSGDVRLLVEIDRGRTAQKWTREPRLDDFVDRVLREGVKHSSDDAHVGRSLRDRQRVSERLANVPSEYVAESKEIAGQ